MSEWNDPGSAAKKIADFLQTLVTSGGLELKSNILACNGQVQTNSETSLGADPSVRTSPSTSRSASPAEEAPEIKVEFTGPDTPLLLAQNGELLHAIEHVAAKILRFEPEDHDRIFFDAEGFKAARDLHLQRSAEAAIVRVRATGEPYAFPPMTSRERRILHLVLTRSGLPSASSGLGSHRFVVLYPEGGKPAQSVPSPDRSRAIRSSFRPR